MGCGPSQEEKGEDSAYKSLKEKLVPFELPLVTALETGAIKLLVATYLRAGGLYALSSRQNLEARETREGCTIFLRPEAAANALRRQNRSICFVTHAWRSCVHPDPEGYGMFPAVKRFLHHDLGEHIVGVFIDYACLHQEPRTPEEDAFFLAALKVMANGCATRPSVPAPSRAP